MALCRKQAEGWLAVGAGLVSGTGTGTGMGCLWLCSASCQIDCKKGPFLWQLHFRNWRSALLSSDSASGPVAAPGSAIHSWSVSQSDPHPLRSCVVLVLVVVVAVAVLVVVAIIVLCVGKLQM